MPIKDLTKPCYYFARELEFQKEFSKYDQTKTTTRYQMKDINDLSRKSNSPIEIHFKEGLIKNLLPTFLIVHTKYSSMRLILYYS